MCLWTVAFLASLARKLTFVVRLWLYVNAYYGIMASESHLQEKIAKVFFMKKEIFRLREECTDVNASFRQSSKGQWDTRGVHNCNQKAKTCWGSDRQGIFSHWVSSEVSEWCRCQDQGNYTSGDCKFQEVDRVYVCEWQPILSEQVSGSSYANWWADQAQLQQRELYYSYLCVGCQRLTRDSRRWGWVTNHRGWSKSQPGCRIRPCFHEEFSQGVFLVS